MRDEKAEKKQLSDYCLQIYPERFFDIIYQNDDIFKPENNVNTYFLPSLDFKIIFNDPTVSENTKKTIESTFGKEMRELGYL